VANLLAVPLGEAVALPVCLVHALAAPLAPVERGAAFVATGALRIVRLIAHAFAHFRPLLVAVPPPSGWQLTAFTLLLLAAVACRGRRRLGLMAALGAFALLAEVATVRLGAPRGSLRATFLDVGQGDAALLDLPDGQAILIDGGGLVGSPVDTGTRVIAPVLRDRRRSRLAAAVLSHPHPDHYTGLVSGLSGVEVGALWDTGQGEREGTKGGYAALLASMREAHVPVLRPDTLCGGRELGGAHIDVLAPCPGPSPDRGPNDNSLVLRVRYGRRSMLFVGDSEHEAEHDLVSLGAARIHADVLKVGHHGSRTSSSAAFIAAVAPAFAVISVGVRNRFGHPNPNTLATLTKAGVRVFRTDADGAVTAWTDGDRLEVRSEAR
jgi:competence protein ComEC